MKERTLPFEAFKFPSWITNPQRATDEYTIARCLNYFDAIRSHLLKVFPPMHFIFNLSVNLKANINGGDMRKKTILYDELLPAACLSITLRRLKPK